MSKYDDFVESAAPEKFWSDRFVRRCLAPIRNELYEITTGNWKALTPEVVETLNSATERFGVTPEMICHHFAVQYRALKAVELAEEEERNRQKLFDQTIRQAQLGGITREEARDRLEISEKRLAVEIDKLNKADKMSEYEVVRQRNIAERMSCFAELGFKELKQNARPGPKARVERVPLPPRPKSMRIQKQKLAANSPAGCPAGQLACPPLPVSTGLTLLQTLSIGQDMHKKTGIVDGISDLFLTDAADAASAAEPVLQPPAELEVVTIGRVTRGRVQSADALPALGSSRDFLIAAGDECGQVGLWRGHESAAAFRLHTAAVSSLTFNEHDPAQLVTSGMDGLVRSVDLARQSVDVIYHGNDGRKPILWHDITSPSEIMMGTDDQVMIFDTRRQTADRICSGVSNGTPVVTDPKMDNLMLMATKNNYVMFFDLRSSGELAAIKIPSSATALQVSPSGKYLMVSMMEAGLLHVYDLEAANKVDLAPIFETKSYSVNNFGLANSAWHPEHETVIFFPTNKFLTHYGDTEQVKLVAVDVLSGQILARYSHLHGENLLLATFPDQPFMVVANSVRDGSVGIIADKHYQLPK